MAADRTVLLVTNRRLDEAAGRAEKFATRKRLLADRGWDLEVGYVDPTPAGTAVGTLRCLRLARGADVVNSVSNPPHLQIVGGIVARLTGTPWLAEFRDPLVENPDVDRDSVAATLRRRIERYVLTHADCTVWYDGIQIPDDYFAETYPDVDPVRYRMLPPIGFERRTFDAVEPRRFDAFTVAYAGSFYEGWIEPYTFIDGLGPFVDGHTDADVRALFYGDWDDDYDEAADAAGVADHVEPKPFVPHEEVVAVLKGADALLYVGGDDPRNRRNIPTKLYDYVGARTPIVAVVDPSFRVAEVVCEHGFGIVVEPGDAAGVADALERIRSGAFTYDPDPESFERFTRERSNDVYVETLESLVE
jgi:glycosyltransferase involved in cell wall biosynthesis